MSKVIEMPTTASKTKRRPKSSGKAVGKAVHDANFTYRLFLIVDLAAYELIVWLKDVLEAPSFGDVVRQAVRAYAIHLVAVGRLDDTCELPVDADTSGEFKKLNIRIPNRTKQRLDMLKRKTDSTYTGIIICGLDILAQTAEEQESILARLEKGDYIVDDNLIKTSNRSGSITTRGRSKSECSVGFEQVNAAKQAIA